MNDMCKSQAQELLIYYICKFLDVVFCVRCFSLYILCFRFGCGFFINKRRKKHVCEGGLLGQSSHGVLPIKRDRREKIGLTKNLFSCNSHLFQQEQCYHPMFSQISYERLITMKYFRGRCRVNTVFGTYILVSVTRRHLFHLYVTYIPQF